MRNRQSSDLADSLIAASRAALRAALKQAPAIDLAQVDPPVETRGWALAADALRFLMGLICQLRPRHVLEFGSGQSTRVLAWTAAKAEIPCRITSVDHDPEFGAAVVAALRKQKLKCPVALQVAPLVVRECAETPLPVYYLCRNRCASSRPADLIVVDGPPLLLGGREGTLYQAMEFARPGTILVLDDANRIQEREIVSRWSEMFPDTIDVQVLSDFTKGLAVVLILRPVPLRDLRDYRLQLAGQELERVIPEGMTVCLIDDGALQDLAKVLNRNITLFYGPPSDSATAIRQVEERRRSGIRFLAFGWPAFWWLEYYSELTEYLETKGARLLQTGRVIVFDIAQTSKRRRLRTQIAAR